MSTRAHRLSSSVTTNKFQWQTGTGHGRPSMSELVPIAFARPTGPAIALADTRQDVEARELHLPSVTTERLQSIEREAHADGYARGAEAAEADTARLLEATSARLSATISEVSNLRRGVMRQAERELVHLAIAIAERLVRRQLETDPDLLLVIARVAIDRLGERAAAVVHLSPADHTVLSRLMKSDGASGLELVSDPAVPRGGCLITSSFGEIDAGIGAQIRELSRELLGVDSDEEMSDGAFADR